MVLEVISNKEHVMSSQFFSHRIIFNSASYIDILGIVVKPWIDRIRNGKPYIFQQGFAP